MKIYQILFRIFSLFKSLRLVIVIQVFLLILLSLVSMAWPFYFGKIIDGVTSGASFDELFKYILICAASVIGGSLILLIKDMHELKRINMQSRMLLQSFSTKKMTELSVGQHIRSDSGFKQSALDQGSGAVEEVFFSINYDILPSLVRYFIVTAIVIFISPLIGIASLLISIIQFIAYQFINLAHVKNWRKFREHNLEVGRWNSEIIRMISQIIFRGASKNVLKEQEQKQKELVKDFHKTWGSYELKTGMLQILGDINLIMVVTLSVLSATTWQTLTVGSIVAVLSYATRMVYNVEGLYRNFRRLAMVWPRVEKFFDILELKNDIKEIKNPLEIQGGKNGYSIEFKNISFSHVEADEIKDEDKKTNKKKQKVKALNDVSFEIQEGEVCAIVGRSGAGKTTIINLLLRAFDPDKGNILISGIELKKLHLEKYRQKVGIVEQDVILQNTTLKDNILFGMSDEEKEKWTDEKLIQLAKLTRIDQFFDRLGDKPFETVVGERGVKLSGGQRQRVGIARALSVDPAILIFDEATSSLDGENEKAIHDAMKEAFKGRTVIVIAHRLSTVRHADKIICMDGGKIAGIGDHRTLYETCLPYKTLVDIQSE